MVILNALAGKPIPVYAKGNQIRDWLYVEDHAKALLLVATKGRIGETYNIGSGFEFSNLEIVKKICNYFDLKYPKEISHSKLISFVSDRLGHDFKYSINSNKLKKLLPHDRKISFDNN